MPTFLNFLPAIALLAAASADRWNIDQSDPIAPAVGEVKLGAANSANAWFTVRPQSNSLAWTLTPFLPATNTTLRHGTVASPGVGNWTPWSVAINDAGIAAVTAGSVDSNGKRENAIVLIDCNRSSSSIIPVGNFFPHWAKVDSKNRIWVVGVHLNAQRQEESGDFPLVRVYSQTGEELARALPRSAIGSVTAMGATNAAFTTLLGDDFLLQIRGYQRMHRLRLDESNRTIRTTTIDGPALLDGPKSYLQRAAECGSSLMVYWRNGKEGGAGLLHRAGATWTPVEIKEYGTRMPFHTFAGCSADGKHKALSASGNLLTLSPPKQ